ncbi:uncharacterized protein LOC116715609 isoform X5 [Xiphophorus hellerii]|uniref:uncharacterized protein LOC116715609 isoform X5 n=1 Tax=Xiphophorus hellerii TaxID=8084 RepID=UPI0013B3A305|nr:uncharacterized protein LOC116715609 isoform X5 [Xiphophorus hellerii]
MMESTRFVFFLFAGLLHTELHGPFIDVRRSLIPPGSLVTCSATGQPAPTVTLTVYMVYYSHYNPSSKTNANGTITVTTTALLSAVNSTLVRCSVEVGFTDPRELLVTVPGVKTTSGEQSQVPKWTMTFVLLMLLLCMCFCRLRRKYKNRHRKDLETVLTQTMRCVENSSLPKKHLRPRTSEKQRQTSESQP